MLLLWLNLKHTCMTYTIFQSSATCQSRCQLLSVLICFLTQNCSKMCEHVPFGVNCNSSFIIDMNCLSNPKDILCDDMGTWKWKGSYCSWLSVDEHGFVTALEKDIPDSPSSMHYRIWKRYYCNKSLCRWWCFLKVRSLVCQAYRSTNTAVLQPQLCNIISGC